MPSAIIIILTIAYEEPTEGLDSAAFTDGVATASSSDSGLDTQLGIQWVYK